MVRLPDPLEARRMIRCESSGACPAPNRMQRHVYPNRRSGLGYGRETGGYLSGVGIWMALAVVVLALVLLGELLVWLQHRKDVADPPCWN
jgi:hypothetical protein